MFAQAMRGYSVGDMAIGFVIVVAIIAVALIFFRHSGVQVPPWLPQIFWVVVAAFVAVAAIWFLLGLR